MTENKKTTKKTRTKAVLVRMTHGMIDYLQGETDEEAPTVPAAARRIINKNRSKPKKKLIGG